MAKTAEAAALTRQHATLQRAIRAAALRDLLPLWGVVDPTNLRGTIDGFARAGALVAGARRRDSVAVGARYYREFRRLEGVPGGLTVVTAEAPSSAALEDAVRKAALAGIVNARRRGFGVGASASNGLVKVTGTVTSLVMGGGRSAVLDAIDGDRAALGWQRSTSGRACAFCAMVASQGVVYKDESGASFEAHDHCTCTPEPFFDGSRPLAQNERYRAAWDEVTGGLSGSDALNAFRQHLAGGE